MQEIYGSFLVIEWYVVYCR